MSNYEEELPGPPVESEGTVAGLQTRAIDDSFDSELLADVPKMGDAMPIGTYAFRLESFKDQWKVKDDKTGRDLTEEEQQPYFALTWKCQQEPYVGRVVFENVPWVRKEDTKAANDPSNPRRAEAKATINNRMPRAKEIMAAAGFVPQGKFGFRQLLESNPEMKLQLKQKERQSKGPDGKWKGNGDWTNEVQKHLSLNRPM